MVKTFSDAELQRLAKEAYNVRPSVPKGTAFVPALSDYETKVFVKPGTNEAVVAFAGTRPWRAGDIATDIQLARGKLSSTQRFKRSQAALARVRRALPGYKITVTGHSLGGSLAEAVASERTTGVSFNPGRRIDKPFNRIASKIQGRIRKEDNRYNTRSYISKYDYVSAGRYLNRNDKRATYYKRGSWYTPLKAHRPTYYK